MYECEQCGRLWLDWPPDRTMVSYVPDEETRGMLRAVHWPPYTP